MKKLILPLILLSSLAHAEVQEISDTTIKNKFLTLVKDVEVENKLNGSQEFTTCREKNKFVAADTEEQKKDKLKQATECFQEKIKKNTNSEGLKKLADNLSLESYGLIKSKNVNDITEYLTNKMTKSLTGIDPAEKDAAKIAEQLKWKNRKIVDQKVFIDLYKAQLIKNALFEVSRYCFENLRGPNKSSNTFESHWAGVKFFEDQPDASGNPVIKADINDKGDPAFLNTANLKGMDLTKQSDVQKTIIAGISSKEIDGQFYGTFFQFCQKALPHLCEQYKKNINSTAADKASGGASCLTMDKLRSIRTTMANTDKVLKQYEEMGKDNELTVGMITEPKVYERGKGAGEESLDKISSYTSTDILSNSKDDLADMAEKCKQKNGDPACEDFLIQTDSLDKAVHNVEMNMTLKKEIEVARVKAMKDKEELKKYLEENGYFDILNKLNTLSDAEIELEIGNIFEARKKAEVEALKLKIGKRQVSEADYKDLEKIDGAVEERIVDNINQSREEKVRLAQVVMFNNIITSQLVLSKDLGNGKTESAGRNVSGWLKEKQGLDKTGAYNESLFSGIQTEAEKSGPKDNDTSIGGGQIVDIILGKDPNAK